MPYPLLSQAEQYTKRRKRRKAWHKVVTFLACIVVFCTTYALILPAITLEQTPYCGIEEHLHDEGCYESKLICGYDEVESEHHVHSQSCYEEQSVLICGQEESAGHIHNENCMEAELVLICDEDHEHIDACYETHNTYACGLLEGEGAHIHGPECYEMQEVLVCDIPEDEGIPGNVSDGHIHSEECYETTLVCSKEEHEHSLACYSNPNADLESASVWERSIAGVELTGKWSDDVIAIAQTQLGYEESIQNYVIAEDGEMKGITRYGQWYGDPYGDWCAMFVSFCLYYAEIPETAVPYESGCDRWIITLNSRGLYNPAEEYAPEKGDIVFFDLDGDGISDHVGFVVECSDSGTDIRTIEGNSSNCVRYGTYRYSDPSILGYAALPHTEEPGDADVPEDEDTSTENSEDVPLEGSDLQDGDSPTEGDDLQGEDTSTEGNNIPDEDNPTDEDVSQDEDILIDEESDIELPGESDEETIEEMPFEVFSLRTAESLDATISIHVQKQWVGDAAYMRPESLTVSLLSNGTETGQTVTLSADNDWSSAFTGNFPKYDENGEEIEYTIREDAVTDYELASNTYTDTAASVDLSTLELWVPVTELEAGENYLVISGLVGKQSLYRAESTVTDGVLSASVTVNEGSVRDKEGNSYTNYILLNPEDETGQSYYLTWKAVSADGGMNLQSNVYTEWNGKIKYLLAQSNKLKVTEDGANANAIFAPDGGGAFQAGDSTELYLFKKVSLDVSSLPAASYTRNYTLVNRYEPPEIPADPQATTTSVQVTKQWDDQADHSADSVTVRLVRDGVQTEQFVTLSQENNWTATFTGLPIYNDEGTKIVYDVVENTADGYQAEYQYAESVVTGDAVWLPANSFEDGVTYLIVTSALTGDVIGLEGQSNGVAWTSSKNAGTIYVSSSDQYPRYITDEEAQKHTAMQWTAEYIGLVKAEQVGYRYVYGLKNVSYGKYLKNTGEGDWAKSASGKEMWFYYGYTKTDANGNDAKREPNPDKTPESDWSYILGSMNDYFLLSNNHTGDANAQAAQTFYLYRRYEIEAPRLNVTIINHPVARTSLTVLKDWVRDDPSMRPETITVHLLANGEDTGQSLVLSEQTGWQGVFENLPTEDTDGKSIAYTVTEDAVAGYTASYFYSSDEETNKVIITNKPQTMLPETGGVGTTPYTVGGILLITMAAVIFLWKKKQSLFHIFS